MLCWHIIRNKYVNNDFYNLQNIIFNLFDVHKHAQTSFGFLTSRSILMV